MRGVKPWLLGALGGLLAAGVLLPVLQARTPRPVRRLPSQVVLPPAKRPLKFSHATHKDQSLACDACHKSAKTSTKAADVLLPGHKHCVGCHEEAKVPKGYGRAGKTNPKKCRYCHTKFHANGFPVRVSWPKPRLRFPHRLHVKRGTTCLHCHPGVDQAKRVGAPHLPKMALCLKCHKGSGRASGRCITCHERLPGGRMRARYPDGVLKPGPSLPTLQHGPLFKKRHKVAARARKKTCRACHQRSTCLRCHGGVTRPAKIHVGNTLLLHGRRARANRAKCKACHTSQRFCQRCHSRTGLSSTSRRSPFVTPGVRKFHGANWASSTSRSRARNRHRVHAKRNVAVCTSCHTQSSCTRCHARRRVGGLSMNPHGPGFASSRRCRRLARKNRRSCIRCHGFGDPLMKCR